MILDLILLANQKRQRIINMGNNQYFFLDFIKIQNSFKNHIVKIVVSLY